MDDSNHNQLDAIVWRRWQFQSDKRARRRAALIKSIGFGFLALVLSAVAAYRLEH